MARLALVAALLLAAVPTLGRLAPQLSQVVDAAHQSLVALCTTQGLRYVSVTPRNVTDDSFDHVSHDDSHSVGHGGDHHGGRDHGTAHHTHGVDDGAPPAQPPHDHGAPDCAYCPLLLSLLVAGGWLLAPRPAGVRGCPPTRFRAASRAFLHPCGLGSRGPPRVDGCLRA